MPERSSLPSIAFNPDKEPSNAVILSYKKCDYSRSFVVCCPGAGAVSGDCSSVWWRLPESRPRAAGGNRVVVADLGSPDCGVGSC